MNRRSFFKLAAGVLAAPAIVRAESLMKIWVPPQEIVTDTYNFGSGVPSWYAAAGGNHWSILNASHVNYDKDLFVYGPLDSEQPVWRSLPSSTLTEGIASRALPDGVVYDRQSKLFMYKPAA